MFVLRRSLNQILQAATVHGRKMLTIRPICTEVINPPETKVKEQSSILVPSCKILKETAVAFKITPGELNNYVRLLRIIKIEEDAISELLQTNPGFIWKCYKTCKSDLKRSNVHRIHLICDKLGISQKEFCSKLLKYKFFLSLSLKRITAVLNVLLDRKVDPLDVFSDLWILRCSAETVASRLNLVQQTEVENIRPWMGRCKNQVFENFIRRAASKQKLLGELSLEEYISVRLGCSVEQMKEVIDREPQLQKTSVLKIKKILDFLFTSGFTASHILNGLPRVANRRIETIHARLLEMNQIGLTPSLYVLCKSRKEYQSYIKKRKNRKKLQ